MQEKIDEIIKELFEGRLNVKNSIYEQAEIKDNEFCSLMKRREQLENALLKGSDKELAEEFIKVTAFMEHIAVQNGFEYGMKLGARLVRDL